MNTSSSAPCQDERLGPGLYPAGGVVHVKIQTGILVQFFGFEIWTNPFLGGKTGAIFWRLRKATATGAICHPRLQCNFQNCYCVAVERERLQHGYTSTRRDGKICRQNIIITVFIISATFQKMLHCQRETCYI